MAPLLLIAIGVASQVFDKNRRRSRSSIRSGPPSARRPPVGGADHSQDQGLRQRRRRHRHRRGLLLFGASGVFAELQDALNNIWRVKPKPGLGIRAFIRDRLLSFTVVLGTGFLLLVSLVLSAALAAIGVWMETDAAGVGLVLALPQQPGVVSGDRTLLFAMIFKILPDAKIDWRDVWIGAAVTAAAVHAGQGDHRRLPRPQRPDRHLRGGRLHRRAADLGVLLGLDPTVRRRVHARLRAGHAAPGPPHGTRGVHGQAGGHPGAGRPRTAVRAGVHITYQECHRRDRGRSRLAKGQAPYGMVLRRGGSGGRRRAGIPGVAGRGRRRPVALGFGLDGLPADHGRTRRSPGRCRTC